MKALGIVIVIGLVLLYFVDAALKIQLFNMEMLIHSAIRFFTGFIILGIAAFYGHHLKLKSAIYLVLALVLADDMMDYFRQIDSFHVEVMLHGVFMLLWGAVTGCAYMKGRKSKH